MPSAEAVQALRDLGIAGLAIFFALLFVFDVVVTRRSSDRAIARAEAGADEWRQVAREAIHEVARLADALEIQTGLRVPPGPKSGS